jgi:hypothetical protein
MKKLLLIVALLTISLTLTFAQDVTAKIVGEAVTKFEVDLDAEGSGLTTWAKASIQIDASTGGREHTSEEDVYGYVQISGLDLGQFRMGWYHSADSWAENAWNEGFSYVGAWAKLSEINVEQTLGLNAEGSEPLNPSIIAKIIAGPMWIQFDGGNYLRAERFLPDEAFKVRFKDFIFTNGGAFDVAAAWTAQIDDPATGRLVFGYDIEDMAGIQLKLSTPEGPSDNTEHAYGIGADISVSAVENLELSFGAYAGLNYENFKLDFAQIPSYPAWVGLTLPSDTQPLEDGAVPIQIGVKAGYTVPLSEDMNIKPYAGIEVTMAEFLPETAVTGIEIGGGVNLTWPGLSGDYAWSFGDSIYDYWGQETNDYLNPDAPDYHTGGYGWPQHYMTGSGVGLYGNYMMNSMKMGDEDAETYNTVNLRLQVFDDFGDGGMIPMLGLCVSMVVNRLVVSGTMIDDYNDGVDAAFSGDDADHWKNYMTEPYFGLGIYANTEIMPGVVPFISMDYTGETADEMLINYFDLNIGAEITAIPNVIITVAWDGQNLMAERPDDDGEIKDDPQLGMIRAQFRFKYY